VVDQPTEAVVLMSIHPDYTDRIFSGNKRVEFRKTRFSSPVSHVIVYATSPVQRVVGYFCVAQICVAHPTEIWDRYQGVAGIDEDEYRSYYKDCRRAIAIEIGDVNRLILPEALSSLGMCKHPPQSFRYVPPATLERVSDITCDRSDG